MGWLGIGLKACVQSDVSPEIVVRFRSFRDYAPVKRELAPDLHR